MLMAKAAQDAGLSTDGTVKSMMELQQKGALVSSKVLPHFAKRMSEAARANGGLEAALNSNRVAMNRFFFSVSEAADIVFKSGFSKGLTELFNTSAESIKALEDVWKSLGTILGSIFSLFAKGIKAITPTLQAFGSVLNGITTFLGDSYSWMLALTGATGIFIKTFGKMGALRAVPFIGQLTLMLSLIERAAFWMEELMNVFTQDKIGVLYDPRKKNNNMFANLSSYFGSTDKNAKIHPTQFQDIGQQSIFSPSKVFSAIFDFMSGNMGVLPANGNVYLDGNLVGAVITNNAHVQNYVNGEVSKVNQ